MISMGPKHALSKDEHGMAPPSDPEAADLRQVLGLLADNRRVIFGVAAAVAAGLLLVTLLSTMRFRTSGRLYLGELSGRVTPERTGDIDLSGEVQGDVGSEVEILRSRSLALRAILASGANVSLAPAGASRPRLWKWLAFGRDPALIDGIYDEVRAVATQLDDGERESRSFRVRVLEGGTYQLWEEGADPAGGESSRGRFGEELRHGPLRLTLVQAGSSPPPPGTEYDMTVDPLEGVLEQVTENLAVSVPKAAAGGEPVKVIHAEFTAASPAIGAAYLKALMQAYLEERQSWKTENATAAESFVTHQLHAMRDALDATERKHAEYRSSTRVVVLDNEAKAMIEQIGKYEEQRVAARLEIASLLEMRKMLANPRAGVEAFFVGESSDTVLQSLAGSLTKAQQELTDLEAKFSPEAPDVRRQRNQVRAQLQTIRNYVGTRLARAQENLSSLNGIIHQFEERLKTVPGAELRLAQLAREAEVYRRMYSYLLERQQQAAIVKASTVSRNRILDAPQRTYVEDSPKLGLRLVTCLLGILLGVVVVLVRHATDPTFQSAADVERNLGLPVFSEIPLRDSASGMMVSDSHLPCELVASASDHTDASFLEAFRRLRGNVYCAASGSYGRIVLMSSPAQGDGKTTCAVALAAALAADHNSVLVVDTDLRTPSVHEMLDQTREPGLSSILQGEWDWRAAVRPVVLSTGKLHVVTAGRAGSSDLLSRDKFGEFLASARDRYDYVILDSASVPLADALTLARQSDLTLSVVRLRHTWRRRAIEHVRLIETNTPSHAIVVTSPVHSRRGRAWDKSLAAWLRSAERPSRVPAGVVAAPAADEAPAEPVA